MAYDSARQRVVLCGGFDIVNSGALGETWEWDGVAWTQRATLPVPRYDHAMAYDAARRRVLVVGGDHRSSIALADTWEWDGTSWRQRVTSSAPAARTGH